MMPPIFEGHRQGWGHLQKICQRHTDQYRTWIVYPIPLRNASPSGGPSKFGSYLVSSTTSDSSFTNSPQKVKPGRASAIEIHRAASHEMKIAIHIVMARPNLGHRLRRSNGASPSSSYSDRSTSMMILSSGDTF